MITFLKYKLYVCIFYLLYILYSLCIQTDKHIKDACVKDEYKSPMSKLK